MGDVCFQAIRLKLLLEGFLTILIGELVDTRQVAPKILAPL